MTKQITEAQRNALTYAMTTSGGHIRAGRNERGVTINARTVAALIASGLMRATNEGAQINAAGIEMARSFEQPASTPKLDADGYPDESKLSADADRLLSLLAAAFTGDINEALGIASRLTPDYEILTWDRERLIAARAELIANGSLKATAPALADGEIHDEEIHELRAAGLIDNTTAAQCVSLAFGRTKYESADEYRERAKARRNMRQTCAWLLAELRASQAEQAESNAPKCTKCGTNPSRKIYGGKFWDFCESCASESIEPKHTADRSRNGIRAGVTVMTLAPSGDVKQVATYLAKPGIDARTDELAPHELTNVAALINRIASTSGAERRALLASIKRLVDGNACTCDLAATDGNHARSCPARKAVR